MISLNFLLTLPMASTLGEEALQALATGMEMKQIPSGMVLFTHGDPGDALYILVSGLLRADFPAAGDAVAFYNEVCPGEFVGEMAVLTGQPRTATVVATEDCELLCLTKTAYDRLVQIYPALSTALSSQLLSRFQRDQTRQVLKQFFGGLDDEQLRGILGQMDCCHLDSGQVLFRQGEPGDAMYIIIQGRLRLVAEGASGAKRVLGEAGTGDSIGEFVLLSQAGAPESLRTASVYAMRPTDMVVITRPIFDTLISQYPGVLLDLTRSIVRRAVSRSQPASVVHPALAITLLPIHPGQTLDAFAAQLTEALESLGSTLHLNPHRFDQRYGQVGASETGLDSPLSLVVNIWLDEREREHKYTVYEASPVLESSGQLSAWARRCVDEADILLLVANANDVPGLTEIEHAVGKLQSRARVELVLVHPSDCLIPAGTGEWLAARRYGSGPVETHHHIRMGNAADFRRVARRIAGKPVGLVLAGGGARGWAHLGVLQALEEAGLEFDFVAGASMGAIVAAGCALGWDSTRLRELAATFSDPRKLLDYTLPYASITATRHITTLLQELFAGANIEDTWRPFFCISADLTHGEERMHTRGPLWKTVRASMAFPAIFAPVLEDGCVLIDGGAANNLPVDRMREICPTGTVIGVDLEEASPMRGRYDFGPSLSGWEVLRGRMLPFARKVTAPTLLDVVAGVVYSNNRYRLNEIWQRANLLIRVPVGQYGLLQFDKYAEIVEAGYQAAQEQLKGLKPG